MWVVAGSALLTLVIAIARIATWIAMRDGSQVQEFAIPQPFNARIARRSPTARTGPVAKTATPAVRAAAVKQSPAPARRPPEGRDSAAVRTVFRLHPARGVALERLSRRRWPEVGLGR